MINSRIFAFDFESLLVELLKTEIERRNANIHNRRLNQAKFPYIKTIESFNFEAIPNLNKENIYQLRKSNYIKNAENIIFLGALGTGKTHLSIDFGMQACEKYYTVRFFSTT